MNIIPQTSPTQKMRWVVGNYLVICVYDSADSEGYWVVAVPLWVLCHANRMGCEICSHHR